MEGQSKEGREGRRGPGKGHRKTQTQVLKGSHSPRTAISHIFKDRLNQSMIYPDWCRTVIMVSSWKVL